MIEKKSKIYVAGHQGMVGSAICRALINNGYTTIISRNSKSLDLRNQQDVHKYIKTQQPDVVINAAARVGGILANNNYPYEFLMDNMLIQNNLIKASHELNVKKFIFLGSSCIYPKFAKQPLRESYLLTDSLEPTNQWYAIAKISGVKLCEAIQIQYQKDFVSLMPTNLYGYHDNFDLETSHVLPAMIRKFHDAKINHKNSVTLWGSGSPMREFLFVDDLAQAVIFSLNNKLPESLYNVGYGTDITIKELADKIRQIIGYSGKIIWDKSKPNGTPKKLMDSSKIKNLGWQPKYDLDQGIQLTYDWFVKNRTKVKELKL